MRPATSTTTLSGINQRGRSDHRRRRRKTRNEIAATTATTNIDFHCGSMLTVVCTLSGSVFVIPSLAPGFFSNAVASARVAARPRSS